MRTRGQCRRICSTMRRISARLPAQVLLARQQFQHRVLAQLLVIVQIFVAQRQGRNALRNHFRHRMSNARGSPSVQKALRQARQQIHAPVGFPQQKTSCVRRHRAAVKLTGHLARKMGLECELSLVTSGDTQNRPYVDT